MPSLNNVVQYGDDWIGRRLEELQRQIDALAGAKTLQAATIAEGGLHIKAEGGITVYDQASGLPVFYIGYAPLMDGSGRKQMVMQVWRGNDGTQVLGIADQGVTPGHPFLAAMQWFDRSGNIVLADDTNGGVGLAVPYIPGMFGDITSPTNTTTSATFAAMQWSDYYQFHPQVTASVLVQTSAGTTGEIRLTVDGQQIGSVVSVPAASFQQMTIGPATWPTGSFIFKRRTVVQLEARRTGGTGTVGVRGLGIWGVQS